MKMTYNKEIGTRLKEARKQGGYTQKSLAKIFNLNKSTISRYENGSNEPDLEFLKEFSKLLNINGDWLLFGQPPIFKASDSKINIEGQILELFASIRGTDAKPVQKDLLSSGLKKPIESLTEETPENLTLLFDYMVKNPEAMRNILKYFHLFVKPAIDERQESQEE